MGSRLRSFIGSRAFCRKPAPASSAGSLLSVRRWPRQVSGSGRAGWCRPARRPATSRFAPWFAWNNQRAQRGRGQPLSIVPVTSHVDGRAPATSIPAVVTKPDGGGTYLEVQLPQHPIWLAGAAGTLAAVRRSPPRRLPPQSSSRVSCLRWRRFARNHLAGRRPLWYSFRRVDGAWQGRLWIRVL